MTNFSWIQDAFSSNQVSPFRNSSYIALSLAEIAARSGTPRDQVLPALTRWVRDAHVPTYAIAWDSGLRPDGVILIAKVGALPLRGAAGPRRSTQQALSRERFSTVGE